MPTITSANSKPVPDLNELLARDTVEDIVLSPRGLAYFENFKWHGPFPSRDAEPKQLWHLANKIAEQARLQLGMTQPSVDSFLRLSDRLSLRAHVVVAPLVQDGPEITLRRLPELGRFSLDNFCMTSSERAVLETSVISGKSILVSGSTGAGKTSFLTALLRMIPPRERILILEDSPELPIPTPLGTKLLCRNDRFGFREGASWTLEDLVFESLRMRPDRIIVGECRSKEALAIRHALQTGHRGTWSTIHGSNPREALKRFNALCGTGAIATSDRVHSDRVHPDRVWDLIVQLGRNAAGKRCVCEIDLQAEETCPV